MVEWRDLAYVAFSVTLLLIVYNYAGLAPFVP